MSTSPLLARLSPRSTSTTPSPRIHSKQSMVVARANYTHVSSWRWKFVTFTLAVILLLDISLRRSSQTQQEQVDDCDVSFGTYRGHEYSTSSTVGTPTCLVESKWLKLKQHKVKVPGSDDAIADWLWIDYHDRINVLVEDDTLGNERRFLVVQQSKYALDDTVSMAVIGGIIEPGEEAVDAARREVAEEAGGIECQEFHLLGKFRTDVNRGLGWVHSFLATNCHRPSFSKGSQRVEVDEDEVGAPDTEHQELYSMNAAELREAVANGQFLEVQWSNTVALALLRPELMPTHPKI